MVKKLYDFKNHPEHKAQLAPWADKWITNAVSTEAMTAEDRLICITAVHGLYAAAKQTPPKHIVFVPSPFVLAFASGFASSIWAATRAATQAATWDATWAATEAATQAATRDATRDATQAATWAATEAATQAATWDATWAATEAATQAATRDATRDATEAATRDATWDATWAATEAATQAATRDATRDATQAATRAAAWAATEAATRDATQAATWAATQAATQAATGAATRAANINDLQNWYFVPADMKTLASQLGVGDFGLQCAARAWQMWQGGNQWSGYDSYISFFRHIVGLNIDYSGWAHWETLSLHSGPRIIHPDFCMISDRPAELMRDEQNRPHAADGPFCRWRDGSALYSVHGVRLPAWVIERPGEITADKIQSETNAEVRRIMVERFGMARYLKESGAKAIDHEEGIGTLYRKDEPDDAPIYMVEVINNTPEADGSFKRYTLDVSGAGEQSPGLKDDRPGMKGCLSARAAVAATFGLRASQYSPLIES
jgi:hypothetical protein